VSGDGAPRRREVRRRGEAPTEGLAAGESQGEGEFGSGDQKRVLPVKGQGERSAGFGFVPVWVKIKRKVRFESVVCS